MESELEFLNVVSNDGALSDAFTDTEPNVDLGENQSVLGSFSRSHWEKFLILLLI